MVLELLATVLSPALTQMLTRDNVCGNQPSCLLIMHGNYSEPITIAMKKAPRETQTLRAGCSKAEPKTFAPPQTPFPEARDGQNLISWRWSLPLPRNPVCWGSMHAISSYRGNRPTRKQTHRQDRLQYTATL